jgi:hypothetical protein
MAVLGTVWGLVMAVSGDQSTMPAHAHLILLGWVSLVLFGIFYHLHPAIDHSRLALTQVLVWIVGTLTVTLGVALIHSSHAIGDPFAALGSVTVPAPARRCRALDGVPRRLTVCSSRTAAARGQA